MSINIVEAIKAPFGKKMNPLHFFGASILFMIPLVNLIILGALVKYINCVVKGEEETFSLLDDKGDSFRIGAECFVGSLLLSLPFIILMFLAGYMLIDFNNPYLSMFSTYGVISVIATILGVIYPIMLMNFTIDMKIMSMIDFKRAGFLLKGNIKDYIIAVLFSMVIGIPFGVVFSIPLIGFVAMLFLEAPLLMIIYHLYGQFMRENKALAVLKNVYKIN